MAALVKGIHHITAISGDPQENVNFYTNILGLKMIKKTINFDDPHTYHLYYGDEIGNPGTILTFFPWGKEGFKGKKGTGQVTNISFSISIRALPFWIKRLESFKIEATGPFTRFDEEVILFEDHDGFELEIIASNNEKRDGWNNGEIPHEYSIRGFYTAALSEELSEKTSNLLTSQLGFKKIEEENNRFRFESGEGGPGTYVDILEVPNSLSGRMGVGAIHHIAYRAENDEAQLEIRETLDKSGFNVTPVIDRNYFHSIYFREPGNILFEVATDPPGFLIDEKKDKLGTHLKLPEWYEKEREEIEKILPAIHLNKIKPDINTAF